MVVPEKLLQLAWKFRMFSQHDLRLSNGEVLRILNPGQLNADAGPDFLNARLRIAGTSWAGNVEIHRYASDWQRHGHENDPAYASVLIHVVAEHDADVRDFNGRVLPVLELGARLPESLIDRWTCLERVSHPIPCRLLGEPDTLLAVNWLERMLIERMESRQGKMSELLQLTKDNREETFYIWFARSFGFHVNALPFEMLARSLPLSILMQHTHSSFQLEALLFGQAGLIPEQADEEYPAALAEEYRFLRYKYRLKPLDRHLWKFLRMRPANFPTVRIAQFAACLSLFPGMLQMLADGGEVPDFSKVKLSPYWQNHYHFRLQAKRSASGLGQASVNILNNNVIAPFLLFMGRVQAKPELLERALGMFSNAPAEDNQITRLFKGMFPEPWNGGDTQAMIHLRNAYCEPRRCDECAIGQHLLSRNQSFEK